VDRPLALRLLPRRLQPFVFHRFFRARAGERGDLFTDASLAFAPGIRMRLRPGDVAHGEIAFLGFTELELTRIVAARARAGGGLFVDVGANWGYFTLLWLAARADNRAVAVEASPRNLEALKGNLARNGCAGRVQVLASAAGREAGRLPFDLGPEDQTGWGGFAAAAGTATHDVDVVRLDRALAGEAVAFLKIDVEGADALVLEGAEGLLGERGVRFAAFERNLPRLAALGLAPDAAAAVLRRAGYRVWCDGRADAEITTWYAEPGA